MHNPLFQPIRQALVAALRLSFEEARQNHSGETFYAFAVSADNHAGGMGPASQTEEAFQRNALDKSDRYPESERGLLRYCPDEWVSTYCGTTRRGEWDKVFELLHPILDDDERSWDSSARPTFETMIEAMAELDEDGFFGQGRDREAITLMIWITDATLAEEWWAKSIKRLNPDKVYKRFLASRIPARYRSGRARSAAKPSASRPFGVPSGLQLADDASLADRIHHEARSSDTTELQRLIEIGGPLEAVDSLGRTPLHSAVSAGKLKAVKLLLAQGANVNARNSKNGITALHMGSPAILKMLLERGAEIEAANDAGWTPLHTSAHFGRIENVRLLLRNGADRRALTADGKTPLDLAREAGRTEVAEILG